MAVQEIIGKKKEKWQLRDVKKTSKREFEKTSVLAQKIIETKNDKYILLANSASADTKWQNRKFLEEKEN